MRFLCSSLVDAEIKPQLILKLMQISLFFAAVFPKVIANDFQ
ncbi:hypothetical protein SOHN41_01494 [Shewanella sp. HN-41]|nr:hypothetical protein SOHN41_01494 [Shewanella sp. HN-41]